MPPRVALKRPVAEQNLKRHEVARTVPFALDDLGGDAMRVSGTADIDLFGFTGQLGDIQNLLCDHVHFADWVRKLQGAYLAGCIQSFMNPLSCVYAVSH